MSCQKHDTRDAANTGFGFPVRLANHKSGIDLSAPVREGNADGNHRFRPAKKNKIPQRSLADRIAKAKKGK